MISTVLGVTVPIVLLIPIVAAKVFYFDPIGYIGYDHTDLSSSPYLEVWSFVTIPLPNFIANYLFFFGLFLAAITPFFVWLARISFKLARNYRSHLYEDWDDSERVWSKKKE